MEKWKKIKTEVMYESGFVRLLKNAYELPDGRTMKNYFVMDYPDWANVVAVTENKKLLLVRQYRAAADVVTLELPGGAIDPGEEIQTAALREFREETGYKALQLGEMRSQYPNPANQGNQAHTLFVPSCKLDGPPEPDEFESFELVEFSFSELQKAIEQGQLQHSIILGAIFLFWDKLRAHLAP